MAGTVHRGISVSDYPERQLRPGAAYGSDALRKSRHALIKLAQEGVTQYPEDAGVMLLGGRDTVDEEHMVTESAIRAFYAHYRKVMEL